MTETWAFKTGRSMYRPGQHGRLQVSHALRPAQVLATLADRSLVEYTMPKGTTALAFVDARHRTALTTTREGGLLVVFERVIMRPCTYRLLLLPWLKAVVEQSKIPRGWAGKSSRGSVPPASKLLRDRS